MAEILALDDVRDACVLIGKILEKKGHRVHSFTEEEEALAFARQHTLDLAVLDIKLKRVTGLEVLASLRALHPEVGIIMLTGYPTIETARAALRLGADEYCVKPIDREELEDKVAAVLQRRNHA
ncbi:MAG: response regulator [Desulfobulbaceae bacterium A2]|nr:MAG: response regulator [Desulfobulbaceae bacterium A2]